MKRPGLFFLGICILMLLIAFGVVRLLEGVPYESRASLMQRALLFGSVWCAVLILVTLFRQRRQKKKSGTQPEVPNFFERDQEAISPRSHTKLSWKSTQVDSKRSLRSSGYSIEINTESKRLPEFQIEKKHSIGPEQEFNWLSSDPVAFEKSLKDEDTRRLFRLLLAQAERVYLQKQILKATFPTKSSQIPAKEEIQKNLKLLLEIYDQLPDVLQIPAGKLDLRHSNTFIGWVALLVASLRSELRTSKYESSWNFSWIFFLGMSLLGLFFTLKRYRERYKGNYSSRFLLDDGIHYAFLVPFFMTRLILFAIG